MNGESYTVWFQDLLWSHRGSRLTKLVVSDSWQLRGPYSPWNSPGQNTKVGSLSLLQGIFSTQELNPGLPHCGHIFYQLSHKGSLRTLEWVGKPFSGGSSWPRDWTHASCIVAFPCGSAGEESACNAGDLGLIPGLGRSSGEGKGYPLQYSGLENSMDCMGSQRVGHDWATFTFSFIVGILFTDWTTWEPRINLYPTLHWERETVDCGQCLSH